MTDEEYQIMKKFMADQIKEIEVQKWLEGERRGCDPGEEFVTQWIAEHAAEFRKRWESDNNVKNTDN